MEKHYCNVVVTPLNYIKGAITIEAISDLRLKGNIETGKEYTLYLKYNADDGLDLAANQGAILD